jgi:hypothetical protein
MLSTIFTFITIYLVIGFITAYAIDTCIRYTKTSEPYTLSELLVVIPFWPFNVSVFICALIKSYFDI